MSKLGTIVTVTDPYTERKCAALVIGEQEDGTLDLRVFRHDQSDIELISVAFSDNESEPAASSDDPAATDAAPPAPVLEPPEPPAPPVQDGTSHRDQREAAPVVASPLQ